jgi:hypothetical protein
MQELPLMLDLGQHGSAFASLLDDFTVSVPKILALRSPLESLPRSQLLRSLNFRDFAQV